MSNPRLLDLFCGAGGASAGYERAGFDVVGVDIKPQPHYPGTFIQADALEYVREHGREFDVVHASPPCQRYSVCRSIPNRDLSTYPLLIPEVREALAETGRAWVIENVIGAPLQGPITLCGIMFGLKVYRHRLFESSQLLLQPYHAKHPPTIGSDHTRRGSLDRYGENEHGFTTVAGHMFSREQGRTAMGIGWMSRAELAQAIPPAYTEFIGKQIAHILGNVGISNEREEILR